MADKFPDKLTWRGQELRRCGSADSPVTRYQGGMMGLVISVYSILPTPGDERVWHAWVGLGGVVKGPSPEQALLLGWEAHLQSVQHQHRHMEQVREFTSTLEQSGP